MKFKQIKNLFFHFKEYLVSTYYLVFYRKTLEKQRLQILSGLLDTDNSLWKYVINDKKAKSLLEIVTNLNSKINVKAIPDTLIVRSDQEIAKLYKDKIVSRDSRVIQAEVSRSVDLGKLIQLELNQQAIDNGKSSRNID